MPPGRPCSRGKCSRTASLAVVSRSSREDDSGPCGPVARGSLAWLLGAPYSLRVPGEEPGRSSREACRAQRGTFYSREVAASSLVGRNRYSPLSLYMSTASANPPQTLGKVWDFALAPRLL